MPCETVVQRGQTLSQRKTQVQQAIAELDRLLLRRKVKPVVGANGGVTFAGWTENRAGVTDACAYRRIMVSGSAIARAELARAEQLAGRQIDRRVVNSGLHSHDGVTWHGKG